MKLISSRVSTAAALVFSLVCPPAHAAPPVSPPPPAGAQEIGPDNTVVAVDGQKWTVFYGAGNNWTSLSGTGISPVQCGTRDFGGDPAPGIAKKCFVVGHSRGASACAADFKNCDYPGDGKVIYGVYGKMLAVEVQGKGSLPCQAATFKGDPAPNIPKNCFFFPALAITPQSPPPPRGAQEIGPDNTVVAIDGQKWTVYYGAGNNWTALSGTGISPVQCGTRDFGGDPAPGVAKKCFVVGHSRGASACAADFKNCDYPGDGKIIYGVYGKMLAVDVKGKGNLPCQAATFKGDPAPNIPKNCFFFPAPVPQTPPPPPGAKEIGPETTVVAGDDQKWTAYYGAGSNWTSISGNGTSPVQCGTRDFGGDPAPGVAKKCFVVGHASTVNPCAADFRNCDYPGDGTVIYGVYGKTLSVDVQGKGSLTCQSASFKGDPAPNIPKNCFFLPAPPKDKPPKTPIDPVAWIVEQANKRKGKLSSAALTALDKLLTPMKAVFLIEEADEDEEQEKEPGAIISVKGKFNWVRGLAAAPGPTAKIAKSMATLAKKLGAGDTVPMKVTLFYRGNELDLELAFKTFDGWTMSGELFPVAKPRVAFRELNFKLHAKLPAGVPQVSIEAEGAGFAQPTYKDPWVALTPAVEINNEGEITFGGAFSGTCAAEPNKDTESGKDCKGIWDVFKLGRISATGGSLRLAMHGGVITGLEASILNGRLGKPGGTGGVEVEGAVRGDASLSPGFGLVLKTKGAPRLMDFVDNFFGPFLTAGGDSNPLNLLYKGIHQLPNPELPLTQSANIIITPTGFIVEEFNYPDPQIFVKANAAAAGVTIALDANIKGDPAKFLAGDIAGGAPKGYVRFAENNNNINESVRKIAGQVPVIDKVVNAAMEGFTFQGVSANVDIDGINRKGTATAKFKLVGKDHSIELPMEAALNPAGGIANEVKNLATQPPPWFAEGVGKVPGGAEALGVAQKAFGTTQEATALMRQVSLVGMVSNPGKTVENLKNVASDPVGSAKAAASTISRLFAGTKSDPDALLKMRFAPFGDSQLSIMCAWEAGRCAFEGTRDVVYGAGDKIVTKSGVTGGIDCTTAAFGTDPAPGNRKACYYSGGSPQLTECAKEGQSKCNIDATGDPQDIYFGTGKLYSIKSCQTVSTYCSNDAFGLDPAQEAAKACYTRKSDCDPNTAFTMKCALEGGQCYVEGTKTIAYGTGKVGDRMTLKANVTGKFDCKNSSFAGGDPVPGRTKYCFHAGRVPDTQNKCASEGQNCKLPAGKMDVYYGAADAYSVKTCQSGTVLCSINNFGGANPSADPAPGFSKSCYWRESAKSACP